MKPTCCGETVEGNAGGKTYWYCRGCKREVKTSLMASANRGVFNDLSVGADCKHEWKMDGDVHLDRFGDLLLMGACTWCDMKFTLNHRTMTLDIRT